MKQFLTLWRMAHILVMASFTFLVGCAITGETQDVNLVSANYNAADNLLKQNQHFDYYRDKPLLVASFVNVDNVQRSSTLGRTIGEQMGSRFAQKGYKVVELKLRTESVFVRGVTTPSEGEFVLSRELQDISRDHDAYALLAGTYGVSKNTVYVTAKLIRTSDGIILASYDYPLPVGPDVKMMLRESKTR